LIILTNVVVTKLVLFNYFSSDYTRYQLLSGIALNKWGCFYFLTINTLCVMTLVCHTRAWLADPGYLPKDLKPQKGETYTKCGKCKLSHRPERAHHCS
jgi:uncharacterized paraquat-inducible protein A